MDDAGPQDVTARDSAGDVMLPASGLPRPS